MLAQHPRTRRFDVCPRRRIVLFGDLSLERCCVSKTFVAITAAVLAISILPWTVSAGPNHPDTAVRLAMDRDGSDVRSKVTLENVGGATAHNVRLVVQLPGSGWVFTASECSHTGANLDCRLQELSKGKTWSVTATRASAPCEALAASARATTPADKQSGNDKATAATKDVCGLADLVLQKIGSRDPGHIRFTLIVTNDGPRASHDVVLIDDLPHRSGFRWRLEGHDARSCTLVKNHVECRWSELADDTRKIIHVVTPATLCHAVYNEASVSSADDPRPFNNVASDNVRSLCPL